MAYGVPRRRLQPASQGCLMARCGGVLSLHLWDVLWRAAEASSVRRKGRLWYMLVPVYVRVFCFGGAYFLEDFERTYCCLRH